MRIDFEFLGGPMDGYSIPVADGETVRQWELASADAGDLFFRDHVSDYSARAISRARHLYQLDRESERFTYRGVLVVAHS